MSLVSTGCCICPRVRGCASTYVTRSGAHSRLRHDPACLGIGTVDAYSSTTRINQGLYQQSGYQSTVVVSGESRNEVSVHGLPTSRSPPGSQPPNRRRESA